MVICLIVIITPNLVNRFTPKTIYKEIPIYRVKEVVKEVEKPIYIDRMVEKIVQSPTQISIFRIEQENEDTYSLVMNDDKESQSMWNIESNGKKIYFRRQKRQPTYMTGSSIGF